MSKNPDSIQPKTMKKYFRIADEWISNGYDAVKAYQSVYPNASVLTARSEFCQIKKLPQVAEHIKKREQEAYDAMGISLQRVYAEMAEMAFTKDPEYPQTIKAKMLEVLGKNLKEDEGKTATGLKITIGVEDDGDSSEEEDI